MMCSVESTVSECLSQATNTMPRRARSTAPLPCNTSSAARKQQGKKAGKAKAPHVCSYHHAGNGLMCAMTKSPLYKPDSNVVSEGLKPCSKCAAFLHHACFIEEFEALAEKSGSTFRLCPACAAVAE
mmetsp:Transcript_25556/g.66928  ORF Transcript_25556/g.66928 Transcript_25556/m.66928 type:complete len:127 (-) Transcript_25556:186-566(-)